MATLLAHSNAVDAATLSGGSWNATYPLNNLKTRYLTQAARTTNAAEASTIIILDLGATKSIGCLGLVRTNLTANATIQIQANTSNAWTTPLLDILPVKAYAAGGDYFQHFGNSAYRYWRVLISDTANAAGFVSIGRLFLGPLFVPTIPNDFNPTLQIESQSQAVMSLGGQEYFESRPNRRVWKFNWSWLPDADVYNTLIPLQLNNDIGGEVIVFCDSPNPNPLPLFSSAMAFDNAYWTKNSGAVTANSLLAPDGTWTADSFIETAATAAHWCARNINAGTTGVALIVSVYAKAIGSRYLQIYSQHAGNVYANFDIQTGTLGTKASAVTSFIEPAANGFYRCYMVVASLTTATAAAGFVCVTSASAGFSQSFAGDGTSGLALWGATCAVGSASVPLSMAIPGVTPTQLFSSQSAFENSYWTKFGSTVTADTTLAPDGNTTADSLIETAATAQHYLGRLINAGTPGVTLIVSVYAKAIGSRYLQIYSQHAGNVYANFDIQTGTLGTKASAVTSFIEPAANGFYRCYMVVASLTTANANAGFVCATSTSHAFAASYAGDGTSGLVLWGAEAWTSNLPCPVYDVIPDAATRGLLTFLGRFRTLDPIAHPYVNQNTLAVEVGELL